MSGRNGDRRPPRPRIEMLTGGATESEAAAIVAALERFIAETAPASADATEPSRWQRAALEEGIAARQISGGGWRRLRSGTAADRTPPAR
jgi:hypothetical protein